MKKEKLGKKGYMRFESRASDYLCNSEKAAKLLEDARKKADKKHGPLNEIWDKVQLFFSIFDDWIKGKYKALSSKSIVMIIVAIVYFVIPTDIIPDFILGFGFGDDIAVLGFVINQLGKDLNTYKLWKENQGNVASSDAEEKNVGAPSLPLSQKKTKGKLKIEQMSDNEGVDYIENKLLQYNDLPNPKSADAKCIEMNYLLKDKQGNIHGGINGMIYSFALSIEHLWVSDEDRGLGYCQKLLSKAESFAKKEKCKFIHLDTFCSQRLEFYKKNGYVVFGKLDEYPDSTKRYYLKKNLKFKKITVI